MLIEQLYGSRGFSEKLTVPHLIKKLPTFYGNPRFITVFNKSRHLSLSRAT
jgi:hypothetical protein